MSQNGFRQAPKPIKKDMLEALKEVINDVNQLSMQFRTLNIGVTNLVNNYNKFTHNTELLFEIMECKTNTIMKILYEKLPEVTPEIFSNYFRQENVDMMNRKEADQDRKLKRIDTVEPAKTGDWVVINYKLKVEGLESVEGAQVENLVVKVGEGKILDELENSFVGKKVGDEYEVSLKFPKDYFSEKLREKDAVFNVKIVKVKTSVEKKDGK